MRAQKLEQHAMNLRHAAEHGAIVVLNPIPNA